MNYNVVKKELQADLKVITWVSLVHCQNFIYFCWSTILAGKTEETEVIKMTASLVVLSLYQQLHSVDSIVPYQKLCWHCNVGWVVFVFTQICLFRQTEKSHEEPPLKRVQPLRIKDWTSCFTLNLKPL